MMDPISLKKIAAPLLIAAAALCCSYAKADIVLSGTRVIYNAKDKDETLRLDNKGNKPLLVQTWVDRGQEDADPGSLSVPFTITPPVFRMEPKRGQTLRIMYNGSPLPADRESVFWLNVLEVPPKLPDDKAGNTNLLQLAFKTRIKLFYRPEGLAGNAADAAKNIKWSISKESQGVIIQAQNNSPYFISFSDVQYVVSGKKYKVKTNMLSPMSKASFIVDGLASPQKGTLEYISINDFGGSSQTTTQL